LLGVSARRLLREKRQQKTPQKRSDEEAEATPAESEVLERKATAHFLVV